MPAQREIALTILLLKLSAKKHIIEQKEKLCKELYYDNPVKVWYKDKPFAKITLLIPTLSSESNKWCIHTKISRNLTNKSKNFWVKD